MNPLVYRRLLRLARVPAKTYAVPTNDMTEVVEWGGYTPFLDWDPANATTGVGDVLVTLPDSSGNGRDVLLLDGSVYPFTACPAPVVIAADASFAGKPSLEFTHTSPSTPPTIRTPGSAPGGAFGLAIVLYAGPATPTNLYAVSSDGTVIGVYDAGAGDQAWHAWADVDATEIGASYDYATTPTVLLITSTGESTLGANDATHRLYAKSLTPFSITGRKPLTPAPWCFGSYQGVDGYSLKGRIARIIVWDVDPSDQATTILNALGSAYGITLAP